MDAGDQTSITLSDVYVLFLDLHNLVPAAILLFTSLYVLHAGHC